MFKVTVGAVGFEFKNSETRIESLKFETRLARKSRTRSAVQLKDTFMMRRLAKTIYN